MKKQLRDTIKTLLDYEFFTEGKIMKKVVKGWDKYFRKNEIQDDLQIIEFNKVLSDRYYQANLSLVAPGGESVLGGSENEKTKHSAPLCQENRLERQKSIN